MLVRGSVIAGERKRRLRVRLRVLSTASPSTTPDLRKPGNRPVWAGSFRGRGALSKLRAVSSLEVGARLRLSTLEMAYGPHAVARADGLVVFVRGAAPREDVEVVIRERRRSHAFADVVAVVRSSPRRVSPPCRYLPRCGGCPWQHLDYAAQLESKRSIVAEQLRRIAGLSVPVRPVIAAPRVFGYRQRIKLRVAAGRVGFFAGASHDLVPIRHCLLAESAVDAALPAVAELVRDLRSAVRRVEIIAVRSGDPGVAVAGEIEGDWRDDDAVAEHWLAAAPQRRGLTLRGRGWLRTWGDLALWSEAEADLALALVAPGFTQVNPLANAALVGVVVKFAEPRRGQRVLDLYAGAGNFSAALARRGAVVQGVESAPTAAAAAANARRLRLDWQVTRGTVERELGRLVGEGERFDTVVLDPPRSGAAQALPALLALRPRRIVYVSCDPSTLARDLKSLRDSYAIRDVQPVDLFPHTYHVETVVCCELSC